MISEYPITSAHSAGLFGDGRASKQAVDSKSVAEENVNVSKSSPLDFICGQIFGDHESPQVSLSLLLQSFNFVKKIVFGVSFLWKGKSNYSMRKLPESYAKRKGL